MTALIYRISIDGSSIFVTPGSITFDVGNPTLQTQTQINGSIVKTTTTPDYTNSRGSIQFSMTANASDNEFENPILLFSKYKQKAISNVPATIKLLPENGVGGMIFTNMKLVNSLQGSNDVNSQISFTFEGDAATVLTS